MKRLLFPLFWLWMVVPLGAALTGQGDQVLLHDEDYDPPVGGKATGTQRSEMKSDKYVLQFGGRKIPGALVRNSKEVKEVEILGKDKVRILMTAGREWGQMTLAGEPQEPDEEKHVLLNVPVILEKKGDEWEARLEKGEPTEEQKEELEDMESNAGNDSDMKMYGDRPRAVGDRWEVDVALLPGFDEGKSTGKVILEIVGRREYKGHDCAEIHGMIDAKMEKEEDGATMTLGMKGKLVVMRSLTHFEDLKYSLKGTMEGKGQVKQGEQVILIDASGTMSFGGEMEIDEPEEKE